MTLPQHDPAHMNRMHAARRADIPCHDCGAETTTVKRLTAAGHSEPWGGKKAKGGSIYQRACPNGHRNWHEAAVRGGDFVRPILPTRTLMSNACYFEGCEYPRVLTQGRLKYRYCHAHDKHVLRYGEARPVAFRRVSLADAWALFWAARLQ